MNKLTLLMLALLVGGLGLAVYLQSEREQAYDPRQGEPLLGEGRVEGITSIRVDDVGRNQQLALERREDGWHLTDPLDFPAEKAMVRLYLEALAQGAEFVPAQEEASLDPHFDPPRAVVTVTETLEGGATREHVLRVGEVDVDGMRLEVRTRGRTLRTLRNLETALDRSIPDLRRKTLFTVNPREVVEIQRLGTDFAETGARDLTLHASRRGATWQLERPYKMQLDPGATGLWSIALARVRGSLFLSDVPDPDLSAYNLAEPELRLRLMDRLGKDEEVHLSRAPSGVWVGKRADGPHVVQVEEADLVGLLQAGRELWDTRLLRAFRRDVEFVDLARVGEDGQDLGTLRLAQDQEENWTVALRPAGAEDFDLAVAANVGRVEELLATLEQNEIEAWLMAPEDAPEALFPAGRRYPGLWVDLRGLLEGERQGGWFGPTRTSAAGTTLQAYHRQGDAVVGLVSPDLASWLEGDLATWRSLLLWSLTEVRLVSLKLSAGERSREFRRQVQGTWRYVDVDAPASELFDVLDALVFLKAGEHLPMDAPREPLEDPVTVEFTGVDGQPSVARIGREAGSGRVLAEVLGLRSVLRDQDLHGRLLGLLP